MNANTASRATYRDNLELLLSAQKPSAGTPAYGRYVNRPTGRRVAALLHLWSVTPNQATFVSASMSYTAILLLALIEPTALTAVLIAVLLAAGYVMDSVDGQLARLRQESSLSGEWLDHTVDTVKTSSLHLAVLVSWYRFPPADHEWILLVPLLYEVVQMTTYFGLMIMPTLRRAAGTAAAAPPAPEHPLRTWLILPTDYGALCWAFLLLAWPAAFLGVYTAFAVASTAMLALALRKWWRELRDLDRRRLADSP